VIAALYVAKGGCYYGIEDVEPWGLPDRDARTYAGPHRVVAHPPCQRWGRYWYGGPSVRVRKVKGDDGGCFAAALASVEQWGGVLEHPEASSAWAAFGLAAPPRRGGWIMTRKGWTCCVEQGHYGHRARKATWLYAVGCEPPSLVWGPSVAGIRLDAGYHSKEERARAVKTGACQRMSKKESAATPIPFRDLLLSMARASG
jgi:hypothetical protein